jgi:hypothetical protein
LLLSFIAVYSLVVTGLLVLSVRKNIQYTDQLDDLDDALQESLELLEEQYQRIDAKTKIEVFSDEPVVRDLIQDIATARESIRNVAGILDGLFEDAALEDTDLKKPKS